MLGSGVTRLRNPVDGVILTKIERRSLRGCQSEKPTLYFKIPKSCYGAPARSSAGVSAMPSVVAVSVGSFAATIDPRTQAASPFESRMSSVLIQTHLSAL